MGLPSAAGLGLIGYERFVARPAESGSGGYLDVGTYGIAGLLHNGAKGLADAFGWLGGLTNWIETVLAVVFGIAVVFGLVLFVTGRGIARGSTGANRAGIALSVIVLLLSAVVLLSLPRSEMAAPTVGMAMAAYAVWALAWR